MRPNQQNRRMRGRNNNNRKGPNPLTRTYESNGPDVKIRGSAQQVADKYAALARDAMSSGDRVMAENYLQHAEHYNRIIAAAQAQQPQQQQRDFRDDMDDDEDGDIQDGDIQETGQATRQQNDGTGPQPVIDGVPAEVAAEADSQGSDQPRSSNRQRRPRRPRNDAAEGATGEAGETAAASADGNGEEGARPARNRRPRAQRNEDDDTGDSVDQLPAFIQG